MDPAIRPRDIQARIRAGESPESVAQTAGVTVEKVMVYAGPVLAERAHVTDRAQESSLRRRSASSDPSPRTLGEAVGNRLREENTDPERVEWDSARREDGRWTLTARYEVAGRTGCGSFLYDPPGNYVTTEDDDARWLVGDLPETPPAEGGDSPAAPRRRLTAVPVDEELPLGDDAIGLVTDSEQAAPDTTGTGGPATGAGGAATSEEPTEEPAEQSGFFDQVLRGPDEVPTRDDLPAVDPSGDTGETHEGAGTTADASPRDDQDPSSDEEGGEKHQRPPRRQVRKSRGRASVPSWDEIMFGDGGSSEQ